jgi:dihydropteroate synthase
VVDRVTGRVTVMGVLNATPDSFSDGGLHAPSAQALAHAARMLAEGADWVDIGGESTRPGAEPVSPEVERARVIPVIQAIHARWPSAIISVDTRHADTAEQALLAGARVVNDVSALGDPRMASVVAAYGARVVLMHMRGEPSSMQDDTRYDDLVGEVRSFLARRAERAEAAGVLPERILLDPGVGFGKATTDNPRLIAEGVPALKGLGYPVVIGASRKRFIGLLSGVDRPADRVAGSIGAALAAVSVGADVVRVHDVAATVHALAVFLAITAPGP